MYSYSRRGLTNLQKASLFVMGVMAAVTFLATNLQAVLWQSSDWLVGAVLPAVVVDLTNEKRAELSAAPLVRSEVLDKAAKLKAEHMAKNEYFSHFSPDGVSPWVWFDAAGYTYAHAGENLAIHFTDSTEVVEAWMDSPTHRENIVNGLYTEIGVGTYKGTYEGYDTVYVVQLFGTPAVASLPDIPAAVPETETPLNEDIPNPEVELAVDSVVEASSSLPKAKSAVLAGKDTTVNEKLTETQALELIPEFEEVAVAEQLEIKPDEIVVVDLPTLATSSGLTAASVVNQQPETNKINVASLATQPHMLLQTIYIILGILAALLIIFSIFLEARQFHYLQVAYGFLLLLGMGALWYVNSLLTAGAVVV